MCTTMLSIKQINKFDKTEYKKFVDYLRGALVFYSIEKAVLRIQDSQTLMIEEKTVLDDVYNTQLEKLNEIYGVSNLGDYVKKYRLEFIEDGFFNDGEQAEWFNRFTCFKDFYKMLSCVILKSPDGYNIFDFKIIENNDDAYKINDEFIIDTFIKNYNRVFTDLI